MVKIVWLKSARNDLFDIFDYIATDSKRYAKLQIEKIQTATEIIKSNIEIGRSVPEANDPSVREIFERKYRIIYRVVSEDLVHIIFVHHSARHFPRG